MRVLLVAPHSPMNRVLTRGLKEEGFEVDRIADVRNAVLQAQEKAYQVLVIDLMPHQSTFTTIKGLREELDLPLVALTVEAVRVEQARALDGDQKVLVKPFRWAELTDCLLSLLKGPSLSHEAT